MIKNKKNLHIITIDPKAGEYLLNMLKDLFGDDIHITYSTLDFDNLVNRDVDVVLTSGEFLYQTAKSLFKNSHIIYAKRETGRKNLDKLLDLPKGKKVLLVNHPLEASISTRDSLIKLGFEDLEYIPYYKGMDFDSTEVDTAISPNMMHLCPAEIKNRINIGSRTISFTTLLEIIDVLDLDRSYIDKYFYQISRDIIEITFNIFDQKSKSEHLRKNLYTILNTIEDSILYMDNNFNITYVNEAFCKLTEDNRDKYVGKNIDEVFCDIANYYRIKDQILNNDSGILNFHNKSIIIKYIKLYGDSKEESMMIITEVKEVQKLEQNIRNILFKKGHVAKKTFNDIVGESKEIKHTIKLAKKMAKNDLTITVTGESGTGKEIFSQAIHNYSPRKDKAFVAVNLASLPESLIESELFGYAEGAFTGSKKGGKQGLFEQAHKGTIFIDEIGDVSKNIQARLLRVLEEKEIMRIGDNRIIKVDVRIITATNKDLRAEVEKGNFREDLYYRLNVLPLHLPPLRKRKRDIKLLVDKYFSDKNIEIEFKHEVIDVFRTYDWPGNVRELLNVMEFINQTVESKIVSIEDLPSYIISNASTIDNSKDLFYYKLPYDKEIIEFTLNTIYQYQVRNRRIGRNTICKNALDQGMLNITEDKIRNILGYLEVEDIVSIGNRGEGTKLTEKGINIIRGLNG